MGSAEALACPSGTTCHGAGAANICSVVPSGLSHHGVDCDLTANGDFGAGYTAAASAIYDNSGGACAAGGNYCIWGTDSHGDNFCCEYASGSLTDLDYIAIRGGNTDDTIQLHYSTYNLAMSPSSTIAKLRGEVYGRGGNDAIDGSETNASTYEDHLHGDGGNDVIFGLAGDDFITGDGGDDYLYGGDGDDDIQGGDEWDVIEGNDGGDTIQGGTGQDEISGGYGNDVIHGDEAADTICGDDGDDILYGDGDDDDVLWGGNDADSGFGGPGIRDICDTETHAADREILTLSGRPGVCPDVDPP